MSVEAECVERSALDSLREGRVGGGSRCGHTGVIGHLGRLHLSRGVVQVVFVLLLAAAGHQRRVGRRPRSRATAVVAAAASGAARLGHLVARVLDANAAAVRRQQVRALQRDQSLGGEAHVSVLDEGYRSTTLVVHAQATVTGETASIHPLIHIGRSKEK